MKISYENIKLKEIVSNTVDTFKIKDNQIKALVTFTGVSFISLASKVPVSRIMNLNEEILEKNLFRNINNNTNIFTLGVAPVINASLVLELIKKLFPKLEDELSEIYNKNKVKRIKYGLTFLIGLTESLLLNNITNIGILISLVLSLGAVLMGIITDYITDHGLINGIDTVIGTNIIKNNTSPLNYLLLIPMTKIQTANIKRTTVNHKGNKNAINFKVFTNGIMPIVIAASILELITSIIPRLINNFGSALMIIYSLLVFIINKIQSNSKIDIDKADKLLRDNSISIVDKSLKRNKLIIKDTINYASNISGIILIVFSLLDLKIPNISNLFILSSIVYDTIIKFKSERNYKGGILC